MRGERREGRREGKGERKGKGGEGARCGRKMDGGCLPGYAVSQRKRKRIEEPFGWGKTIGGLARPMLRGVEKLGFKFTLRWPATI